MTKNDTGFVAGAAGEIFCVGSLSDADAHGDSVLCPICDRTMPAEGGLRRVDRRWIGLVPEHNRSRKGRFTSASPSWLARGRQAALNALRDERTGALRQTAAMVLSRVCMELGLQLTPEECAHPGMQPDGSCVDCGHEPAMSDDN